MANTLDLSNFMIAMYRDKEYILSPWKQGMRWGIASDGTVRTFDTNTLFYHVRSLDAQLKTSEQLQPVSIDESKPALPVLKEEPKKLGTIILVEQVNIAENDAPFKKTLVRVAGEEADQFDKPWFTVIPGPLGRLAFAWSNFEESRKEYVISLVYDPVVIAS